MSAGLTNRCTRSPPAAGKTEASNSSNPSERDLQRNEQVMTTAIIGVGQIGKPLAEHLVAGGERVVLAARDPSGCC